MAMVWAHEKRPTQGPVVLSRKENSRLAAGLLDLGATLTDLEFRIALANDVDASASFYNLAIRMAILQSANTTYNFHRIDLVGRIV
jgi:hypothetical protein